MSRNHYDMFTKDKDMKTKIALIAGVAVAATVAIASPIPAAIAGFVAPNEEEKVEVLEPASPYEKAMHQEICRDVRRMTESIMRNRHSGAPKSDFMNIQTTVTVYREWLDEAYSTPRPTTPRARAESAKEFGELKYQECLDTHPVTYATEYLGVD